MDPICFFCKYYTEQKRLSYCAYNENDPTEEHLYCDCCNHYDPDPDKIELEYQMRERFTSFRE